MRAGNQSDLSEGDEKTEDGRETRWGFDGRR